MISLEEISSRAKQWMGKENRVIIVQGPEAEGEEFLNADIVDIIFLPKEGRNNI